MKGQWIKFSCIFIACIFILLGMCYADELTFGWDANTETDLAGYRLYTRIDDGIGNPYALAVDAISKDVTSCTYVVLDDEVTNYFVVRAYDEAGNESGDSNEVSYTPDNTPPANPTGLGITNIDISVDVEVHISQ